MSLTYKQAIDDIQTIFLNAITPSGVKVHWENVRDQRDPSEDPWVQFVIRHASGRQASLGGVGNRDFERQGTAIAAVFVPIGKGLSESYSLAKTVADAYEGVTSPNGVWFRNVRIQEIGRDGEFHQTQVLAEFSYYETK
jgi:hypothetical protein